MDNPAAFLPQKISDEAINALLRSIGLPKATTIIRPQVTAAYHSIFCISLPPSEKSLGHADLILRVSGNHLPTIKTKNEVGVMAWITKSTTIPIPDMVAYDASTDNPVSYEYTLLSCAKGSVLADVYDSLEKDQMERILDQLIGILLQLHAYPWSRIGGLTVDDNGLVTVSRVVDETFWQVSDAETLWPPGQTVDTLNIHGPFSTYVDFITAQTENCIRLIGMHDKLAFMRDLVPRLHAFMGALSQHAAELNQMSLRLAHKDLHFANILIDTSTSTITSILDWEFSGIVPYAKWDARHAFLWNARQDATTKDEKSRLWLLFEQRCQDLGALALLEDAAYASERQEHMQKVADYLRAIVEVSPRGQRQELVYSWRDIVLGSIEKVESNLLKHNQHDCFTALALQKGLQAFMEENRDRPVLYTMCYCGV